jgi:hypothetical protein
LFPTTDAQGKAIAHSGNITMFSGIIPGQSVTTDGGNDECIQYNSGHPADRIAAANQPRSAVGHHRRGARLWRRRETPDDSEKERRRNQEQHSYNTNSRLQVIGLGALADDEKQQLTESERRNLIGR